MTPLEDLTLLRAFVRIAESGGISAAARTLQLPQPTLSRHLRTLEERCGVALLHRDTHRMKLTEAGQRLLEDARAMLELAEAATQRLHGEQSELRGHLRLFATIDGGQFTVTRLIARFLQANPGVTAELGYTNRPAHMIEEGFDAGVVVGAIADERVVARPAGTVTRHLAASPELVKRLGLPKTPAALASWPWVSLSGDQFGGAQNVVLRRPGRQAQTVAVAPVLRIEGVTGVREAARAGLGVAIVADWLAREDFVSGRLVRVLPQWRAEPLPVAVIFPSRRRLPARVRAFVDFAVAGMAAEMRADA